MARGNIFGKVNVPTTLVKYDGVETETANVVIDNEERTIAVNVKVDEVVKDCATKEELEEGLNTKQDTLVSSENIKTISSHDILGEGDLQLTKEDVGLSNVDNTSDLDKPISTATQSALDSKVSKTSYDSIIGDKDFSGWVNFNQDGTTKAVRTTQVPTHYNDITPKWYVDNNINLIELTWLELKTLRDNSQLIPGRFYRITDYHCTTTTTNTSSADHNFDIIVRADSSNKLNEEASAIRHSGDTYFANNNLSAWKLWYCLDNDTNRFAWANIVFGKGVIYRMIDEFGNDCPYDFKNILFTSSGKYTNAYTFSYTESSVIKDASLLASKKCYNNIIKESIDSNKQWLNFNVFYSTSASFSCNMNTLEKDCQYNTFGNGCCVNTFENHCRRNVFGDACTRNTFIYGCESNTFGSSCGANTFGKHCEGNTFGNSCVFNTFGDACSINTFGNNCSRNTLEKGCQRNTFGDSCTFNTFGDGCSSNTFGNSCTYNMFGKFCQYNKFGIVALATNYCKYNIIDSGCQYLNIYPRGTASASNQLQNIHIHLGVQGTSSKYKTITVDRNLSYTTDVYPVGSTEMFI